MILFIAKILHDNNNAYGIEETNAIYIQELVYKYLIDEISNHEQIELFFRKKNNFETLMIK